LDDGPEELDVEVPWLGVRRLADGSAGEFIEREKTGQIHKLTKGGHFTVQVDVRGWSETMVAKLHLDCAEPDTGRRWALWRTVKIQGPPRMRFLE
jgi:hypothetical protein